MQELFTSGLDLRRGREANLRWEKSSPAEVLVFFPQLPGTGQTGLCWLCWLCVGWVGWQTGLPSSSTWAHGRAPPPRLAWAQWSARHFPEHQGSSVLWNFLCFNKCGFTNVSLGENIFLLFLCVASLGLSVEVKPIVLTSTLFFPHSCTFFLSLFFWRGNKSLVLVPSLASIPLTCWVLRSVAVETGAMTRSRA